MVTFDSGSRMLFGFLVAAALGMASGARAIETGRPSPKPSPPDIINCGDPATAEICGECDTGGPLACCWDPKNCIIIDTTTSAVFHYSVLTPRGLPSFSSYLAPR